MDDKSLNFIKNNITELPLHMQFYILAKVEDMVDKKKKEKKETA